MADIKLGIEGSEVTLPEINWMSGNAPEFGVDYSKNLQIEMMADGSKRVNFLKDKRKWTGYSWGKLTYSQVQTFITLNEYNQILRFQNNWESSTWYYVVITSFSYRPLIHTYAQGTTYYELTITLEEV